MNERIRRLAEQALDQAVPETWTTLSHEQLVKFQEKFAQLIVRQCAGIAYGSDMPSRDIRDYFGVES